MHVENDKLPRGRSYPVQAGTIASALAKAGVTLDCTINYNNNLRTGFTAHFWPPNPNVGVERLYIEIGAVSSEEIADARRHMNESILPAFVTWIRGLLSLPLESPVRREKQIFQVAA
jgi:hypothetical protein